MLETVLYQMTTSNVSGHMYVYMQPLSLLKCPSNYNIYVYIFWGFQLLISVTVDNTIDYNIVLFSEYLYAIYAIYQHVHPNFSSKNEFIQITV